MKPLLLARLIATPMVIALVALSVLIATVCNKQQVWLSEHAAPFVPGTDGPDSSSFIQGLTKVHVDRLGQQDHTGAPSSPKKPREQAVSPKLIGKDGATAPSGDTLQAQPRRVSEALQIASTTHTLQAKLHSSLATVALRVHEAHSMATNNAVTVSIVCIIVLCLALSVFVMFHADREGRRGQPVSIPSTVNKVPPPPGFFQSVMTPRLSSASLMSDTRMASPQNSRILLEPPPDASTFGLRPWSPLPPTSPMGSLAQMLPNSSASLAPRLQNQQGAAPGFQAMSPFVNQHLPPPLCPNVVLPNCEVRVGVPMRELGKITSEGELTIVGLSGNPLLRATLQKSEAGRTLEISMPEPRSAPRAVVGPSIQEVVAGPNKQKARAVQIHGMKGVFYGMLEMRSSGACYVVKDGETVLIIDGDSESLQLAITSGQGVPLAAVTCSSEPFGGSEHLEIRVQPGVDTVLVLACVLAVVLLSPYPPSD